MTMTITPCLKYGGKYLEDAYNLKSPSKLYKGDSHIRLAFNIYMHLNPDGTVENFKETYISWCLQDTPFRKFFYLSTLNLDQKIQSLKKQYDKRQSNSTTNCLKYCNNSKIYNNFCRLCPHSNDYLNARFDIEKKVLGYALVNGDTKFLNFARFNGADLEYVYYEDIALNITGSILIFDKQFSCVIYNLNALVAMFILNHHKDFEEKTGVYSSMIKRLDTNAQEAAHYLCTSLKDESEKYSINGPGLKKYPERDYSYSGDVSDFIRCTESYIKDVLLAGKSLNENEYKELVKTISQPYKYNEFNPKCLTKSMLYTETMLPDAGKRKKASSSGSVNIVSSLAFNMVFNSPLMKQGLINEAEYVLEKSENDMSNSDPVTEVFVSNETECAASAPIETPSEIKNVPDDVKSVKTDNSVDNDVVFDEQDVTDIPVPKTIQHESTILDNAISEEYAENAINNDIVMDETGEAAEYNKDETETDSKNIAVPSNFSLSDVIIDSEDTETAKTEAVSSTEQIPCADTVKEESSDIHFEPFKMSLTEYVKYDVNSFDFLDTVSTNYKIDTLNGPEVIAELLSDISKETSPIAIECCHHKDINVYGLLIYLYDKKSFWFLSDECYGFTDIMWHIMIADVPKVCINYPGVCNILRRNNLKIKKLYSLAAMYTMLKNPDRIMINDILALDNSSHDMAEANVFRLILPAYADRYKNLNSNFESCTDEQRNIYKNCCLLDSALSFSYFLKGHVDVEGPLFETDKYGVYTFKFKSKEQFISSDYSIIHLECMPGYLARGIKYNDYFNEIILNMEKSFEFIKYDIHILSYDEVSLNVMANKSNLYYVSDIIIEYARAAHKKLNATSVPDFKISIL